MSEAIVQFCNHSDARLASCGLTRYVNNEIYYDRKLYMTLLLWFYVFEFIIAGSYIM